MPNVVAHAYIAEQVLEDATPDHRLGSVWPDFAGVYRDHIDRNILTQPIGTAPDLEYGVRLHRQTDTVFDEVVKGTKLRKELFNDLDSSVRDLGRWATWGVTAAANDILFDIRVLERDRTAYEQIRHDVLAGNTSIDVIGTSEFSDMVRHFFRQDRVNNYADMTWLAGMLQQRFEARPRQAMIFDDSLVPDVAGVLSEHYTTRIAKSADEILAQTVIGVRELLQKQ